MHQSILHVASDETPLHLFLFTNKPRAFSTSNLHLAISFLAARTRQSQFAAVRLLILLFCKISQCTLRQTGVWWKKNPTPMQSDTACVPEPSPSFRECERGPGRKETLLLLRRTERMQTLSTCHSNGHITFVSDKLHCVALVVLRFASPFIV